jgi:TRAP-type C4-dicarboxylate transport system permease small subunit
MTARTHTEEPTEGTLLRVVRFVDRLLVRAMWFLRVIAGLVIIAMMLTTVYDVVMRYVFAAPTEWALILNSIAVLAATFLAVPHLLATNGHIDMDLVYRRFGPTGRAVADTVTGLAALSFGACMAWLGYRAAISAYVSGLLTSGNFAVPFWTVYAFVYIGGLGLVLVIVLSPWRREAEATPEAETLSTREGVS